MSLVATTSGEWAIQKVEVGAGGSGGDQTVMGRKWVPSAGPPVVGWVGGWVGGLCCLLQLQTGYHIVWLC